MESNFTDPTLTPERVFSFPSANLILGGYSLVFSVFTAHRISF
ncbi:hypothetical protein MIDIC_600001 [Alphaproteobacteria bacterium]